MIKGDNDIIELLNDCLTAELTAINQYFLDYKMLENWGYQRLAAKFREDSIDEMGDADILINRILFIDGFPNLQRMNSLRIGETPVEKLKLALDLEYEAMERLNAGIKLCVDKGDNGSRDLLQKILNGEESHADWLESQLTAIEQIGEANYLAQQITA